MSSEASEVERVAFLIDQTGVRLGCLLNPETVVIRRLAGVRARRSAAGQLTGAAQTDDPLLYTGGGRTELDLDLLFDVSLVGSNVPTQDVRSLTGPLWDLAENTVGDGGYGKPSLVRFVWGKSWNVPGIVTAVAERLENFTPEGVARRSWLRLRLLRVGERVQPRPSPPGSLPKAAPTAEDLSNLPPESLTMREVGAGDTPGGAERLDSFLARNGISPQYWKLVAALNGIDDPLQIAPARLLRLPPPAALGDTA